MQDAFMEILKKRRSVRKYKNEAIPKEKLEMILQAGLISPSGRNRKPWEFVVVEEHEFAESKGSNNNSSEGGFGGGMMSQSAPAPMAAADGFMNIPDGIDEELPFN